MMGIYLDNNSSSPIDERVLAVMVDVYLNSYGNADSRTHNHGEQARIIVENARKQVASLLEINSSEVFFTSGSTESNNINNIVVYQMAQHVHQKAIHQVMCLKPWVYRQKTLKIRLELVGVLKQMK